VVAFSCVAPFGPTTDSLSIVDHIMNILDTDLLSTLRLQFTCVETRCTQRSSFTAPPQDKVIGFAPQALAATGLVST
jgi:hypothetical protein